MCEHCAVSIAQYRVEPLKLPSQGSALLRFPCGSKVFYRATQLDTAKKLFFLGANVSKLANGVQDKSGWETCQIFFDNLCLG